MDVTQLEPDKFCYASSRESTHKKTRLNWLSVGEAAAVAVWSAHLQRAALLHISSVHAAWYTDHCGHAHVDK